jgi:hypothetical protein
MNHDGTIDHNGIALWVNDEAFIMAMPAIPPLGSGTCVPSPGG